LKHVADFEGISSCSSPKQRAKLFLTSISASLEAGYTASFYSLLRIMANYGTNPTKELSTQIIKSLPSAGQSANGNYSLYVELPLF